MHIHFIRIIFSSILLISHGLQAIERSSDEWDKKIDNILSSHPEVMSWRENVRSLYHAKETVDVLPDTKIGLAYRSYPVRGRSPIIPDLRDREDTPGMTGREISIIQEIPYLDKLRSDKKLLYWDYQTESERFQLLQNEFLGNLYILLSEKKFLNEELKAWKNIQNIQKSVSRISQANFSSGGDTSLTSLRDKNDNIRIGDRLIEIETRLEELTESLRYYLGDNFIQDMDSMQSQSHKVLDAKWTELILRLESSLPDLAQENPNLRILESNIQKARERERRDDLEYYPDAEVFLAYMNRNSRTFRISQNPLNYGNLMPTEEFSGDLLSFGVTLKVPTWSLATKKDLNQKNRSLKSKEIQARLALEKKLESEIKRLAKSIEGKTKQIDYYKKELLPTLQRSSRISSGSVDKGSDSTAVLRLKMEYLRSQVELTNLERDRYQSIIQLLETTNSLLPKKTNNIAIEVKL